MTKYIDKHIISLIIIFLFQIIAKAYDFDTLQYKKYIDSVIINASQNPTRYAKIGKELLLYLEKSKSQDDLIKIYEGLGLCYYYIPDKKEALLYFNHQKALLHKKNDYKELAKVYNRIGSIYVEWSLYTEALKHYNIAYNYALKSNDLSVLAMTYNNLGLINLNQKNYNKAYDYFIKAKEIYQQLNDNIQLAYVINNLGIIYKNIKSYDKAIYYFRQSLELKNKFNDDRLLANIYENFAELYFDKKDYTNAINYFNKALELNKKFNDNINVIKELTSLAKIYCIQNNYAKTNDFLNNAEKYINKDIPKKILRDLIEVKALCFEKKGDYKTALEYTKQLKEIDNSLFNEQLVQKTIETEYLINTSSQENELTTLKIQYQTALKEYQNNLKYKYLLFFLLIVLFFTLVILFIRYRLKQKSLLTIAQKNLEIEKINEELTCINEELDIKVKERTNELLEEIKEKDKKIIELEKQLNIAKEEKLLKEALIKSINQEIRTPLSSIIGLSEVLKERIKNVEQTNLIKFVDGIVQSSNRLLDILNNFLDTESVEVTEIKPRFERCNINKIIKKAGDLFTFKINEKKLSLTYYLGDIPDVYCDADLMLKVFIEIIDNSVKYTNKGKIEIYTSLTNDNKVKISIKDTGIGIDEIHLAHIFDSESFSLGLKNTYTGNLIKLPTVKRIINLMNGQIEISSKKNYGTTVTIIIPSVDYKDKVVQEFEKEKLITETINKQKGRILLVEDDDFNALFISSLLEPIANVTIAKTGEEALQIISKHSEDNFDVIIMDINLPYPWEGVTLLNTIREKFPKYVHVPFIAQTAYTFSPEKEKIINSGFAEYFTKPIDTEYFLNYIKLLLNRSKS